MKEQTLSAPIYPNLAAEEPSSPAPALSSDEYKVILDEIKKYRAMKKNLRRKHAAGSVLNKEAKNELIKRGREQAHACFAETTKKLATSDQNLHLNELCVFQRLRVLTPTVPRARSVAYSAAALLGVNQL